MDTDRNPAHSRDGSPPMRFQRRDEDILKAIQKYGGVLAKRHLKELFWLDKTWRAMEKRLAKLHGGGYVDWAALNEWRTHPLPEPVCWLGWRGAALLAASLDVPLGTLSGLRPVRHNKLEQSLRKAGFHWLREPHWLQLRHDLQVVDFRLMIEKAVREHPTLSLGTWVLEREFRATPGRVHVPLTEKGGAGRTGSRTLVPDGFFSICDQGRLLQGQPSTARFLVEVDLATEDRPRFAREKLVPGVAYLKSREFQQRFGCSSARWLVVTRSETRLRHLKEQAEHALGHDAALFYLTTLERLQSVNALSGPVWNRGGAEGNGPLLDVR